MRTPLFMWCLMMAVVGFSQSPSKLRERAAEASQAGDWYTAYAYLDQAFAQDSASLEGTYQLGLASFHIYNDPRCLSLMAEVNRRDMGKIHPDALLFQGSCYQRLGKYEEAIKMYNKFIKKAKASRSPEIKLALESAQRLLGSCQWALKQVPDLNWKMNKLPFNTLQFEGQAQWSGDSLQFAQLDSTGWHSGYFLLSDSSVIFSNQVYEGEPILFIQGFGGSQWGLAKDQHGHGVLLQHAPSGWVPVPELLVPSAHISSFSLGRSNGFDYLFFASNRPGGHGGMDLWCSRWSSNRWSDPLNLGTTINTVGDELQPVFKDQVLYFSSDFHLGFGGQDVFFSNGNPGNWSAPVNAGLPFNSPKNDIGLDIHARKYRAVSSARDNAGCCLDVFVFQAEGPQLDSNAVKRDSSDKWLFQVQSSLPVKLYFHNDEPDPGSLLPTTLQSYRSCQQSYLQRQQEYKSQVNDPDEWEEFVQEELLGEYQQLQQAMAMMKKVLQHGDTLFLEVRGFASSLAASDYNERLTQRRIASLYNELADWDNGTLKPYLVNGQLMIVPRPFGESQNTAESDDANNKKASVYSKKARYSRRIEIEAIHR
jgi:hypothetical protein